jgi:hypothetical protein
MADTFRWFFQNGILFGQHHSAISKIIDDFSAEDNSVVLSIESGSRREAANRRAWSTQSRTKAAANALERETGECAKTRSQPPVARRGLSEHRDRRAVVGRPKTQNLLRLTEMLAHHPSVAIKARDLALIEIRASGDGFR